jgi:hypothetical protein
VNRPTDAGTAAPNGPWLATFGVDDLVAMVDGLPAAAAVLTEDEQILHVDPAGRAMLDARCDRRAGGLLAPESAIPQLRAGVPADGAGPDVVAHADYPLEVRERLSYLRQLTQAAHPEMRALICEVGPEANITKHSGASRATVRLQQKRTTPPGLLVEIVADGAGSAPCAPQPGHLGLSTMTQRVERLGGVLQVDPGPGEGTRVSATVPLPPAGSRTAMRARSQPASGPR